MAKKLSAWNKKVRKVAKSNPNLSFKSVIKKAKREYKGSSTTKKRKKVSRVRNVVRRYRRKRKTSRRRGLFNLRSMFSLIRVGSFVAPAVVTYSQMSGSPISKAGRTLMQYGGIDSNGRFNYQILTKMWVPLLATTGVTAGVSKISSLIRRI